MPLAAALSYAALVFARSASSIVESLRWYASFCAAFLPSSASLSLLTPVNWVNASSSVIYAAVEAASACVFCISCRVLPPVLAIYVAIVLLICSVLYPSAIRFVPISLLIKSLLRRTNARVPPSTLPPILASASPFDFTNVPNSVRLM